MVLEFPWSLGLPIAARILKNSRPPKIPKPLKNTRFPMVIRPPILNRPPMLSRSSLTTEPQQLSSHYLECIFFLNAAEGHTLSICMFSFQTRRFLDTFPGHSDSLKRMLTLEFHFFEVRLVMLPLITYQYENSSY